MINKILKKALVLFFVLIANVVMAGGIYDLKTTTSIEVNPCDFPIQFIGIQTELTETIEWVAIEGNIQFSGQGTRIATVIDLEDGTATLSHFKLGYILKSDMGEPLRRDTITLHYSDTGGCVEIDIGGNPDVIECDADPNFILARIHKEIPSSDNYKYVWSTTSEGIMINMPNSAATDFNISTPGLKTIQLNVYTLPFENWVGTHTVSFGSNCSERYSLEGNVKANTGLWNDGMIYLYNVPGNSKVDSSQLDDGSYLFSNILTGTYTLYAMPYTDNSLAELTTDFVPTYYVNKQKIEYANSFKVTGNTYGVDLKLIDATTVSVADDNAIAFSIYPIPFSEKLSIEIDQVGTEITVSNTQGNTIYKGELDQSTSLNTTDWSNGVYFIQIKTKTGVNTFSVNK